MEEIEWAIERMLSIWSERKEKMQKFRASLSQKNLFLSWTVICLALGIGITGGFFIGQQYTFADQRENESNQEGNSISPATSSLLASVSEVMRRSFGQNVSRLSAEVPLEEKIDPIKKEESIISKEIEQKEEKKTSTSTVKKESRKKNTIVPKECASSSLFAENKNVRINEIAWMGKVADENETASTASRREWLELLNSSSSSTSLANWQLIDSTGNFKIVFPSNAIVKENSFYLLARNGVEKIVGEKPDLVYAASLSNNGLSLRLVNDHCEIVDQLDATLGWPAGNKETKQTMERDENGLGWHTSVDPGGTPKEKNSVIVLLPQASSAVPVSIPEIVPLKIVYPKLLITEIMTASGSSTKDEFVELYNPQDQAIGLTDWYLQKETKSGSSLSSFVPKSLLAGHSISAHGYFVIAHPSSSFIYNVGSDEGLSDHNTIILKNPNGEIVDKVGWGEASDKEGGAALNPEPGESLSRVFNGSYYEDTDQNQNDFEISECPSPGALIGECAKFAMAIIEEDEVETFIETTSTNLSSSSLAEDITSSTLIVENQETNSSTIDIASSTESFTETSSTTETSTPAQTITETSTLDILSPPNHVIIFKIQTTGGSGKTENDFVSILNPTSSTIDISGWKLRKRTQSGSESSVKVINASTAIEPGQEFIWANSKDGFSESINANTSSTQTIADNTSVALFDVEGNLIDAVAWGINHLDPFIESEAFPKNPEVNQVLKRKSIDSVVVDSDENSRDFEIVEVRIE